MKKSSETTTAAAIGSTPQRSFTMYDVGAQDDEPGYAMFTTSSMPNEIATPADGG
jgi:hypothetical protein